MAEARVQIEGANVLRRNLRKVQKDLPKGMKRIHQEIAEPVVALAQRKARRKSGTMAGTIRSRPTTTMARIQAGPLIYLPPQHWGWPGHNITPNMFVTEAMDSRRVATLRLYEQKLGHFIESVWQDTT